VTGSVGQAMTDSPHPSDVPDVVEPGSSAGHCHPTDASAEQTVVNEIGRDGDAGDDRTNASDVADGAVRGCSR
jgi:hypothetical protein